MGEVYDHAKMVMQTLNQHRKECTKLCDLNLCVGERLFPAHRSVLAACSRYFHAMFSSDLKESRQKDVELADVDAATLEMLVDFAYTGSMQITSSNVENALSLSTQLQFDHVQKLCCDFLEMQLDCANCINIRRFAELHACDSFLTTIDDFICANFSRIVNSEDFHGLPFKALRRIISSNKLCILNEECVYTAVIKWTRHDLTARSQDLLKLLEEVRLPLLPKKFLMQNLETEELIKSSMPCRDLLDEAKNFHIYPEIRGSLRNHRTLPRHSTEGFLYAIGGKEAGEEITNKTECYSMLDNKWREMPSLQCKRQQLGVCALEGLIYAIAGSDGVNRLNTVEVYDKETNSWKNSTPLQTCRSGVGVGVLGGAVYALGGYDGSVCLSSVERFDPENETWTYIASTNFPRSFPGVCSLEGRLYVCGGNDGSTFLDTCETYDPHTDKWVVITPMGVPRAGVGCAVLDGQLYAAGGFDGNKRLNLIERYDPRTDTWTTLAPMTSSRDGVCMTSYCGFLFAIGGIDGPSYLNSVEYYDPLTDTWTPSKEMLTSRAAAGVAIFKNDVISQLSSAESSSSLGSTKSDPVYKSEFLACV